MKYRVTDNNAIETSNTLTGAAQIAEDWYEYLEDQGKIESVPFADLDATSLDALNASIEAWQRKIGEAMGQKDFYGHGNYHVPASVGLDLRVEGIDDDEEAAE